MPSSSSSSIDDAYSWFSGFDITQIQLDIVGFLAILGEGSVLANSDVAHLSKVVYLPRLLPAPQALMRPTRPSGLEPAIGFATGVESGNHKEYINHVGNVLTDTDSLPEYAVKCIEIRRKHNRGEVNAKMLGPLSAVAILGFVESLGLLSYSIWRKDALALLATVSLSLLSSIIGIGNKWTLNLPKRKQPGLITPPGNVVIKYPNGSFLVVQCHEDVARELYFAPESMAYLVSEEWKYRMITLLGTFLLMVGIISLGNSSTQLQIGFAVAYVALNVAYWVVAALPSKLHWDMSCFEIIDQCYEDDLAEHRVPTSKGHEGFLNYNQTFTQALFKVIVATKDTGWAVKSKTAPDTPAWDEWLREASEAAGSTGCFDEVVRDKLVRVWEVPSWNPQESLNRLIRKHMSKVKDSSGRATALSHATEASTSKLSQSSSVTSATGETLIDLGESSTNTSRGRSVQNYTLQHPFLEGTRREKLTALHQYIGELLKGGSLDLDKVDLIDI